jgi:hypothetical protein
MPMDAPVTWMFSSQETQNECLQYVKLRVELDVLHDGLIDLRNKQTELEAQIARSKLVRKSPWKRGRVD